MIDENEIWHAVCTDCHPQMDIAICGTEINFNPDTSTVIDLEDGQDCVVCDSMLCPTCPEIQIKGTYE